MIYLAPSILSADFLKLEEQIKMVEANGADYIHVDVMDGHFVPNISFGPFIVSTLKKITALPLDVHLMISNPDQYIEQFAKAGSDIITVHYEALNHLHRTIQLIRQFGIKAGVAVNPATPVHNIYPVISELDLVLIMTVNPGFGGQNFIKLVVPKIAELSQYKRKNSLSFLLEVDGGINPDTAGMVTKAGAEVLVAGNAIFARNDIAKACHLILASGKKNQNHRG